MDPSSSTSTTTDLLDQLEQEDSSTVVKSSSCLYYFDQMSFCFSPANQFRYYYTWGLADTCDTQVDNFWRCIRNKLKGTSSEASEEEKPPESSVPKREGHLWTFRETPPAVFAFPETEWSIPSTDTEDENKKRTFI